MKINTVQTYNNNKSSVSPNFTGRHLNGSELRKLGTASIFTSTGLQSANFASGGSNVMLMLSGLLLGATGMTLNVVSMFIKNGTRLKLQKNIDFFKAQNVEQAANFAEQNFKIKHFDVNDLDTANWINNGLTNFSNRFQGETYMPSKISLKKFQGEKLADADAFYNAGKDIICFNENSYVNIDTKLKLLIDLALEVFTGQKEHLPDIIQRYIEKPNSFTNPQKLALCYALSNKIEMPLQILHNKPELTYEMIENPSAKDFGGKIQYNEFGALYHEMGHMLDYKGQSMAGKLYKKLTNQLHFRKEIDQMPIRSYAKTSQNEFIADTVAGMLNEDTYPQPMINLFNKLTSIRIPAAEKKDR